ncbi:uncharacterized protein BCR38DRAFT_454827 [Pseudomassariella vexata]|uniref:C2H2-type domain-containing protein n=1 Tax=Pseudomassariella vexata TaxID=1141098 RepID=A0A1Y2EEC7_9PEZI|nr:uncharacterized protein BCR38DRAFT_454827 [Pseudomassariella vexata]ORY69928.1 hypothetical protein BCR38DRAFT_454827 [Pseudomassariella vexata]
MKRSRGPEEDESSGYPTTNSDELDGAEPRQTELPAAKITELDESAVDTSRSIAMRCSLPPHREPLFFTTYVDYEAHYNKTHTNRCSECRRNFPSEHLLSVHIEESHDAFAAVLRLRGEHTYSCFVEGCDRKCATPQKRRMHLIDKHMYPKNYFFAVTREGIDGRNSLLLEGGHPRRKSSASQHGESKAVSRRQSLRQTDASNETDPEEVKPLAKTSEEAATAKEPVDTEMDDLAGAMSSLQFVPTSIRFGRGKGRGGFSRR